MCWPQFDPDLTALLYAPRVPSSFLWAVVFRICSRQHLSHKYSSLGPIIRTFLLRTRNQVGVHRTDPVLIRYTALGRRTHTLYAFQQKNFTVQVRHPRLHPARSTIRSEIKLAMSATYSQAATGRFHAEGKVLCDTVFNISILIGCSFALCVLLVNRCLRVKFLNGSQGRLAPFVAFGIPVM